MALTPEDIDTHWNLLHNYERQVAHANAQLEHVRTRLRKLNFAIEAEKFILRQNGVDI